MNDIRKIWEGADSVEIVRLPAGETGLTAGQRLTAERLEAIAEWFAIPEEKRNPKDVLGLARALGISAASVRKWQRDPRMLRRVVQKTREFATYLMPNIVWSQYKNAMATSDPRSAAFVRDTVGMGNGGGGVHVTTNVNVTQNMGLEEGDDLALQELSEVVERRVRARRPVTDARVLEETPGDQTGPAVEAVQPDPSDRAVS